VVEVPQLGDDVQAIKAGILETADVFVVNKADQPGAERAAASLRLALGGSRPERAWQPPIVKTVAATGEGVPELVAALDRHRAHLGAGGLLDLLAVSRAREELETTLQETLLSRLVARVGHGELDRLAARIARRELDASTAARELLRRC
jgi:LAO/AO transport system kinase